MLLLLLTLKERALRPKIHLRRPVSDEERLTRASLVDKRLDFHELPAASWVLVRLHVWLLSGFAYTGIGLRLETGEAEPICAEIVVAV